MKSTLRVFDPPLCCSTGVCGTTIDPDLVNFGAMLKALGARGVKVERFNLAQQPRAFAEDPAVKSWLAQEGPGVLPIIYVDGELWLKGRYPSSGECAAMMARLNPPEGVVAT